MLENGKEVAVGDGVSSGQLTEPMNEADALDIVQAAIWTVLTAAGPAVLVAMVVGVAIALHAGADAGAGNHPDLRAEDPRVLLVVALSGPFIGTRSPSSPNVVFARIQNGF